MLSVLRRQRTGSLLLGLSLLLLLHTRLPALVVVMRLGLDATWDPACIKPVLTVVLFSVQPLSLSLSLAALATLVLLLLGTVHAQWLVVEFTEGVVTTSQLVKGSSPLSIQSLTYPSTVSPSLPASRATQAENPSSALSVSADIMISGWFGGRVFDPAEQRAGRCDRIKPRLCFCGGSWIRWLFIRIANSSRLAAQYLIRTSPQKVNHSTPLQLLMAIPWAVAG